MLNNNGEFNFMNDSNPFNNLFLGINDIPPVNVGNIGVNKITANTIHDYPNNHIADGVYTNVTIEGTVNYNKPQPYSEEEYIKLYNTPYSESELLDGYLLAGIRSKFGRAVKFNEDLLIKDFIEYLAKTYNQHYEQGVQPNELIFTDYNDGIGFTKGNVVKYAQRYGKKNGKNRDDLLKALHYALLALYVHDKYEGK